MSERTKLTIEGGVKDVAVLEKLRVVSEHLDALAVVELAEPRLFLVAKTLASFLHNLFETAFVERRELDHVFLFVNL